MTAATLRRQMRDASLESHEDLARWAEKTELGWVALAVVAQQLVALSYGWPSKQKAMEKLESLLSQVSAQKAIGVKASDASLADHDTNLELAEAWAIRLKDYASGTPDDFRDIPLGIGDLTPLAQKVTAKCRDIDRGSTVSYGELAKRSGRPRAARAVGSVMAKNRFPLIVPCHRVLGAGGCLGGYSAPQGLNMKRRLLAMEQVPGFEA